MLTENQIDACRGEGFVPLPRQTGQSHDRRWFECPFCGPDADHRAYVMNPPTAAEQFDARPLVCSVSQRIGWVSLAVVARETLLSEESRFRALLARYVPGVPLKAAEAVGRWHSEGIPLEAMEDDVDVPCEMHRLAQEHRDTGKRGERFGAVYA